MARVLRWLVVSVTAGLLLVGCSQGKVEGKGESASSNQATQDSSQLPLEQPGTAAPSPTRQGDPDFPPACQGMAQVPRVDGASPLVNQTLERIGQLIDAAACQGEATEPDQVIPVRVVPQDGGQLTYVWQGVVQASQAAYPGISLTCVTVDLDTGEVLVPGSEVAGDPAMISAIEQLVFEGAAVGELAQVSDLADELSQPDQWTMAAPALPSCLWSGQKVILVPVIHALGEWLPILVNDWQAVVVPPEELFGP